MSDIFDRLSDFMRGVFNTDDVFSESGSHDPDMQAAWEELESFLQGDSSPQQQKPHSRSHKANSHQSQESIRSDLAGLRKDYKTLEVPFLADIDTVRSSYKRLVQSYHPDRFAHDPERMRMATEVTLRLTSAYTRIKEFEKHRGHNID